MLITEPRIENPDAFYDALMLAHQGLSLERSHELNARLVLLLANQVGRLDVLEQVLAAARANLDATTA